MFFEKIAAAVSAPVPFLLIGAGVFFAFRLRFFFLRHPKRMLSSMLRPSARGGVSPFRAVTVALAGTLGVGNIVGVAGAVALGGFGAVFWMWVSAICASVLKYAEITLAVSHRRAQGGELFGGAPYYIRDLFSGIRRDSVGKAVAAAFAVLCIAEVLSTGCGIQINSAAEAMESAFGVPPLAVGLFAAAVTFYAANGGAKSVSRLTVGLIPLLSLGYILISLAVLMLRWDELPRVFALIFSSAFEFESAAGGVLGFFCSRAMKYGAMRGLLSNEAGCGTAPLAHASAETDEPAEQGFWGIFEVLFDTVVLCTLTASVIIISYEEVADLAPTPIIMVSRAFSCVLGEWAEYFLALSVAAFGIATVVCCAHYGSECAGYLSGGKNRRAVKRAYLLIYIGAAVIGATVSSGWLWAVSDISLSLMTAINVPVLCAMSGEVRRITEKYFRGKRL